MGKIGAISGRGICSYSVLHIAINIFSLILYNRKVLERYLHELRHQHLHLSSTASSQAPSQVAPLELTTEMFDPTSNA